MKSKIILIPIIMLFSFNIFSNKNSEKEYFNVKNAYYWISENINFNKELHNKYNPKILLPLFETLSINLLIGSYNKYITESSFAQISFNSIKNNFKHGFDLDADDLYTNFVRHPLQGSIYYNTARSNGYNYYESMLVTLFGSLQWEFFMETEPAAINDVILTTFAGAMLGEVFYRMSNHIIDETTVGFERFLREGSLAFFNPGRLINRTVRGRLLRNMKENIYERKKYFADFKLGLNNLNILKAYKHDRKTIYLKFTLNYNDIFLEKSIKPFDYFYLSTEINPSETNIHKSLLTIKKTNLFGTFRLFSILYGFKLSNKKNKTELLLGIFENFDYLQNNIYQIGSLDLSIGLMLKSKAKKDILIIGDLTLGVVPMAGVDSLYSKYFLVDSLNESRNYNFARGITSKMNLGFHIPYLTVKVRTTVWYLDTYHGSKGKELIGIIKPSIHINLLKRISLGVEASIYHRKAKYDKFPDFKETNKNYKAFVEFKL